ncbi:Putative multidrug export ATP-binding/permease protein SAV1866 [Anaerococcus octavius]|jgi:ABC transporter, ATP-binding protein|uniref:Multidrug export ATP-binding/permease protein SAV1866 n=1 Tax=Anaerococcus octavius TaxID=54007 RepID=A0A380WUE9_9FIRM|nr:ABC transporter ATP-binding protein [Anaerococcus octavius]SUU92595.1 Putative multidrug export ATP-binding/permease protein SAV1866 [Anaerococcus octavius]
MIKNITLGKANNIRKSIVLNILASISNLIPFIALAKIVEALFLSRNTGKIDTNLLWKYFVIMAVFFFVTIFFENLATKYTYELGYKVAADGRIELADHIRKLPIGYLSGKSSTEILDTLMNDFFKIETAVTHQLPQFFSGICVAIVCSILFLIIDVKMGIATFIGLPISILLLRLMQNFQKKIYLRTKKIKIKEDEDINEYLDTIKTLKAYNSLEETLTKLERDIEDSKDANIKNEKGVGSLTTIASMILRIGLPLMSLVGSYLFLNGNLEIDTFLMFLFVGTRIFDPLELALVNYNGLQIASVSGENILRLLNAEPMKGEEDLKVSNNIEIRDLSFSYKESKVLDDVTLDINENELTAFVGYSGSGKSTLIKLISRFYDPDEGTIKIGGIDLAKADPYKLMDKFSVVFQDVYLFKDTIYNNIKFGNEDASKDEIINAAKMAGAYDFIIKKENGFDTMIGQGGATLSGGEKQRISIARAILKDAPIILLDEATSSLDPENELIIQEAISNLIKNKTVIVVAHKLRSVMGANKIVVLNKGKVEEVGKHEELIKNNGLYKDLWNYQEKSKEWKIV